jgi:outer membrane protein
MRNNMTLFLAALLSAGILANPVPAAAEPIRLSVDGAVRLAVERNLGLQVETYNPAIAAMDIRRARSIYDPTLSATIDHRGGNQQEGPSSSFVDRTRHFDVNASLDQLLSTGATASASFTNFWAKDNLGVSRIRYAQPQLTLSLSQPLLKGSGKQVTERGITVADDTMELSMAGWNQKALDTAAEARNRYLILIKARESLATRNASLAVARRVHEENTARVKAGVLAAFELQDSELGVLQREKDLLDTELSEKDATDQLRLTLHLPPETILELPDTPWADVPAPSEEEALGIASRRRPDLSKARTSLRIAEFNERVSGNLALPSLSFEGSAGVSGIAAEYGDAFDDLRTGNNPYWAIGFRFSVPLGNGAARAEVASARLKTSQARAGVAVIEESAGLEIRTALRALETRRKQNEVARKGISVAETRLASFLKRGKLGLSRTKDVLDAEANLTQARENLSAARADFQSALTSLWKSTGELLDRHGVRIEGNSLVSATRKENS